MTLQMHPVTGIDPTRNLDIDRALFADPTVPGAIRARIGDNGTETLTTQTGLYDTNLAEDGTLGEDNLMTVSKMKITK